MATRIFASSNLFGLLVPMVLSRMNPASRDVGTQPSKIGRVRQTFVKIRVSKLPAEPFDDLYPIEIGGSLQRMVGQEDHAKKATLTYL